jgi:hypothetical protein
MSTENTDPNVEESKKEQTTLKDEISAETLDSVAGGTVINPQPLPPRHMPD